MMTIIRSTSILWKETHAALVDREWTVARALLDDLAQRDDNHDRLSAAEAYGAPQHIADRINLVNSKVI